MSESTQINSAAKSYNDFTALGELRGKAQRNEAGAMRESAEQFEALFIQMMLKSMREASSVMKSDLFPVLPSYCSCAKPRPSKMVCH